MSRKVWIAPSIERADWLNLEMEIRSLENAGVDLIHIDIMDRTYGDTILLSPHLVTFIKRITKIPLDIHLYVSHPEVYFPILFECCEGDYISLEIEAVKDISKLLADIKKSGNKPAISVEIGTPDCFVETLIPQVDLINVLVRNVGYSSDPIMPEVLNRVETYRKWIDKSQKEILLEADGSLNFEDTKTLFDKGVDVMVYGTKVIFRKDIPYKRSIEEVRKVIK